VEKTDGRASDVLAIVCGCCDDGGVFCIAALGCCVMRGREKLTAGFFLV